MEKVILIKYGELTTKKDNRKLFINVLYNNLKEKLEKYNVEINYDLTRMFINFKDEDLKNILNVVKNTFGIHAYKVCYKINSDIESIKESILELVKEIDFDTFKVDTKRSDKSFPINSIEFNNVIGSKILKNIDNKKVDVHNPELLINIEIRRDYTYISFNEEKGLGGYPVGVMGKGLLMLSGGIDSPVAGYLALKRGIKLDLVYFEAIPHTSLEARDKVITLAKKLLKYTNKLNLYIIPITKLQEEIYKTSKPEYVITLLRRMMYRISERLSKQNKDLILINGESIGQVASQTLTSMNVINEVVSIPVIRPLACMDKLEIIDISKKIDTYETSILPYEDCCTIFVPRHPVINPKKKICEDLEKQLNYEELIDEIFKNIQLIKIKDEMKKNELL